MKTDPSEITISDQAIAMDVTAINHVFYAEALFCS